jgi:hypothetical protein
MEALERGELPAVPQPQGLTVQMRPYQLQSLQFMLDQERGDGGFRRFLYFQVHTCACLHCACEPRSACEIHIACATALHYACFSVHVPHACSVLASLYTAQCQSLAAAAEITSNG